ncbi:MAG: hypothetical protein N2202_04350 [Proteobacteria bacterium]|nr:hypothetical protein [Pseudomonadota bacterium]
MSNKGKLIFIILITIFVYIYFRMGTISNLKNNLDGIDRKIKEASFKVKEFENMNKEFIYIDAVSFIEKVIEISKQEKIENINITNKTRGIGERKDKNVYKNTIFINIEDDYRKTAEFIRELFNLNYNFTISKIEMMSSNKLVKTVITVELLLKGN